MVAAQSYCSRTAVESQSNRSRIVTTALGSDPGQVVHTMPRASVITTVWRARYRNIIIELKI